MGFPISHVGFMKLSPGVTTVCYFPCQFYNEPHVVCCMSMSISILINSISLFYSMSIRSSKRQIVKRKLSRRYRAACKRAGIQPKHYTPSRPRQTRPRLDPSVLWPTEREFMSRFRLPVERVRQLTEMFRASRACKAKNDNKGIPLFHKASNFFIPKF